MDGPCPGCSSPPATLASGSKEGGRQRAAAPEDGREQEEVPGPPDAQQRPGFMDLHIAHGAVLAWFQVATMQVLQTWGCG